MVTIYIRKLRYNEAKTKLLRELDKAFVNCESEVEIIHGIGTYTLRKMVETEIDKIEYAEIIMHDARLNPGALRVKLLSVDPGIMKKYIDI